MNHPSSVINGGGEGSAASSAAGGAAAQPNQQQQSNQSQATAGTNHSAGHHHPSAPRGAFSSPFSSAGRFPFDDSDDDMFGDLDMRARMNRMGAFDWGAHKRAGGGGGVGSSAFPDADAFFNNDFGFPSAFGSTAPPFDTFASRARNAASAAAAGRKPPAAPTAASATGQQHQQQPATPSSPSAHHDRSHFYDHLPEEFRQYFPESFGHSFPRMRQHSGGAGMAAQSPPTTSGFVRQQQQQQQPQYQPQSEQHFVPQHTQPQQQHPIPTAPVPTSVARPLLCDAAIQTDSLPGGNELQQPAGLRNTVDLGQKCQQESVGGPERSQSAPPAEQLVLGNAAGASPAPSTNSGPYETAAGAFANTGTSMTPQQAPSNSQSQQSQFVYPKIQQQQQQQPQPVPSTPQSAGERKVPIFVEGRSSGAPVPPQRTSVPPPRPTPFVPHSDQVDNSSSNTASAATGSDVPQTPHTADCIGKIQSIQSNVLDLMGAVDRFSGCRGDKEYMYIDEMLTRNLLKLDTIDTQGRESIRLARKEAIRCIQASITVLEAKAEQNTNRKKAEEAAAAATTAIDSTVPAVAAVASVPAQPTADNIEQSLEDKLADFQESKRAEVQPQSDEPETHVTALQVNLKPVGKTN